jgi:hypothetical protein
MARWIALPILIASTIGFSLAHHGGAAYDQKTTIKLQATITGFQFINPHAQIFFDSADSKGNVIHWNCEGHDPANMERQGWKRSTLKPGDHITIFGHPAKNGVPVMLLVKVVLADGKELDNLQTPDLAG